MDRIPNRSEKKSRCLCLTTGGADRLSLPERSQDRQLAPFLVSSHLLSPQQSDNFARISQHSSPISFPTGTQFVTGLCLNEKPRACAGRLGQKGDSMQNGSVIRAERQRGPDVWEFRWREPGADGKRRHRRMVLGSVEQLGDEAAARQAIARLKLEFNRGGAWLKMRSASVSDLVSHYRERELDPDTVW
jgi:hypothetical protein